MSQHQRLFFALWPEEPLRKAVMPLLQCKQECGGRAHPPSNLHLTLNFLGGINATTRDCLEQAAAEIIIPPFELTLDHFGYWPRPRVVWLGCRETPASLIQLVKELNRVVEQCGLQPEQRPYQPHMTLLRKAQEAPAASPPELHWKVNHFVLAESLSTPGGVEYRVLRQWPLQQDF